MKAILQVQYRRFWIHMKVRLGWLLKVQSTRFQAPIKVDIKAILQVQYENLRASQRLISRCHFMRSICKLSGSYKGQYQGHFTCPIWEVHGPTKIDPRGQFYEFNPLSFIPHKGQFKGHVTSPIRVTSRPYRIIHPDVCSDWKHFRLAMWSWTSPTYPPKTSWTRPAIQPHIKALFV